jgi:hypothetical protein
MAKDRLTSELDEFAPWDWIAGYLLAAAIMVFMFALAESIGG